MGLIIVYHSSLASEAYLSQHKDYTHANYTESSIYDLSTGYTSWRYLHSLLSPKSIHRVKAGKLTGVELVTASFIAFHPRGLGVLVTRLSGVDGRGWKPHAYSEAAWMREVL